MMLLIDGNFVSTVNLEEVALKYVSSENKTEINIINNIFLINNFIIKNFTRRYLKQL